jgi:hypothetical protein
MYVRPAHFDLPQVDLLTKSRAEQAVLRPAYKQAWDIKCLSQITDYKMLITHTHTHTLACCYRLL